MKIQEKKSLPSWECGLKYRILQEKTALRPVAPFVGVWIEIAQMDSSLLDKYVAPFVGVWIEIFSKASIS